MDRSPEDIQDEWLVIRCQAGEREALHALVARWQPRLLGLARRLTADCDAARDIAQDAWLAVVRGLSRLDDPAGFRAWAYRIVANRCADWVRRRVARRAAPDELRELARSHWSGDPEQPLNELDEQAGLGAALRKLGEESRAILGLHYLDGLALSEIASVLDLPVGTVKSRLHAARERLRCLLRDDNERT